MKKFILILCLLILSSCFETKKQAYTERRGLMMMEKHEYARNQKVYKPLKKHNKNHKKAKKSMKHDKTSKTKK